MAGSSANVAEALNNDTLLVFEDAPLEDILDYLSTVNQVPIRLDENAFSDSRSLADRLVTININGHPFGGCLSFLLDQLGLTCVEENGQLLLRPAGSLDGTPAAQTLVPLSGSVTPR